MEELLKGYLSREKKFKKSGPQVQSLLPIEKALWALPDEDRWIPVFWTDLKKIYRRRETDEILQLLEKSNVVLLEGYSASGKSSLVARLAYDLVRKNKKVYYGNLTTGFGIKCEPKELPGRLDEEAREIREEIFIIIEDIHHFLHEFERLNCLVANRRVKLILTGRPLKRYRMAYIREKVEGESVLFRWIPPDDRLVLATDITVVGEIIEHRGLSFNEIDRILTVIGKKEPNLLLLSFLMEVAKKEQKRVDEINEADIIGLVEDHLWEIADQVCGSEIDYSIYWKMMGTISWISIFEVPVEERFLLKDCQDKASAKQILNQLESRKEIVSFEKIKPEYRKYYIVPHSRLAFLYRTVCLEETKVLDLAGDYILNGEFFGTLIRTLYLEDETFLDHLFSNLRKKLTQKDLSKAGLAEIRAFLWGISRVNKQVAREIVSSQAPWLKAKPSEATNEEQIDFLLEIGLIDKDPAKKIRKRR